MMTLNLAGVITLLTDFGSSDTYVAEMKGEILKEYPQAIIIDITHKIKPFDIFSAAHKINKYYNRFPKGTIHIAVVDPGVGSSRLPVLIETDDYIFIGPDNGLFTHPTANERRKNMKLPGNPMIVPLHFMEGIYLLRWLQNC